MSDWAKRSAAAASAAAAAAGIRRNWIVPRSVMCSLFWTGVILVFTGMILLVTSKHKGRMYESWGAVLLGLGLCFLLICLILCAHAYFVIAAISGESATTAAAAANKLFTAGGGTGVAELRLPPPGVVMPPYNFPAGGVADDRNPEGPAMMQANGRKPRSIGNVVAPPRYGIDLQLPPVEPRHVSEDVRPLRPGLASVGREGGVKGGVGGGVEGGVGGGVGGGGTAGVKWYAEASDSVDDDDDDRGGVGNGVGGGWKKKEEVLGKSRSGLPASVSPVPQPSSSAASSSLSSSRRDTVNQSLSYPAAGAAVIADQSEVAVIEHVVDDVTSSQKDPVTSRLRERTFQQATDIIVNSLPAASAATLALASSSDGSTGRGCSNDPGASSRPCSRNWEHLNSTASHHRASTAADTNLTRRSPNSVRTTGNILYSSLSPPNSLETTSKNSKSSATESPPEPNEDDEKLLSLGFSVSTLPRCGGQQRIGRGHCPPPNYTDVTQVSHDNYSTLPAKGRSGGKLSARDECSDGGDAFHEGSLSRPDSNFASAETVIAAPTARSIIAGGTGARAGPSPGRRPQDGLVPPGVPGATTPDGRNRLPVNPATSPGRSPIQGNSRENLQDESYTLPELHAVAAIRHSEISDEHDSLFVKKDLTRKKQQQQVLKEIASKNSSATLQNAAVLPYFSASTESGSISNLPSKHNKTILSGNLHTPSNDIRRQPQQQLEQQQQQHNQRSLPRSITRNFSGAASVTVTPISAVHLESSDLDNDGVGWQASSGQLLSDISDHGVMMPGGMMPGVISSNNVRNSQSRAYAVNELPGYEDDIIPERVIGRRKQMASVAVHSGRPSVATAPGIGTDLGYNWSGGSRTMDAFVNMRDSDDDDVRELFGKTRHHNQPTTQRIAQSDVRGIRPIPAAPHTNQPHESGRDVGLIRKSDRRYATPGGSVVDEPRNRREEDMDELYSRILHGDVDWTDSVRAACDDVENDEDEDRDDISTNMVNAYENTESKATVYDNVQYIRM